MFRTEDRIDLPHGYHLTMIDRPDRKNMAMYLNDKGISDNTVNIPHPYGLMDADAFIDHVLQWEEDHGLQKDWALREPLGKMIGSIGLLYDFGISSHKSGLGYWLARDYWNQGLMTTCLRTFSQTMLQNRDLIRLEAYVFDWNTASAKCLEKSGFVREGFCDSAFMKEGQPTGAHLWALVKSKE
ncbi:MAG: GNAT family N-acetyltransferase [Saprospiraceae bacterium]|nr:GNAT family N-acetyltransferase [Saprospiraceae bacterium]